MSCLKPPPKAHREILPRYPEGLGPTPSLALPAGHRAAVTVSPEPEPCQGRLYPRQLPQDAAHGSDDYARHDQPRTISR